MIEELRFRKRVFFYSMLLFVHMLFFLKTGAIPTKVEALILLTLYAMFYVNSIEVVVKEEE